MSYKMDFQLRVMTPDDIPAGMRLKEIAGWNQTRGDWERFLSASPAGCFVAEAEGGVVGTATTICYEGRFAWIGMVLVDPACRSMGIGTKLLEKCVAYLDTCGIPSMKLDATPLGKPLYQKLGFVTEMLDQDREIFGSDRSAVLRAIGRENPQFVLQCRSQGKLSGYCLGRRGALADHLGPWVARDEITARTLLEKFLLRSRAAKVFVDAVRSTPWAIRLLREQRFQFSRTLTRMYRGSNDFPGRPVLQGAIVGPEFG